MAAERCKSGRGSQRKSLTAGCQPISVVGAQASHELVATARSVWKAICHVFIAPISECSHDFTTLCPLFPLSLSDALSLPPSIHLSLECNISGQVDGEVELFFPPLPFSLSLSLSLSLYVRVC